MTITLKGSTPSSPLGYRHYTSRVLPNVPKNVDESSYTASPRRGRNLPVPPSPTRYERPKQTRSLPRVPLPFQIKSPSTTCSKDNVSSLAIPKISSPQRQLPRIPKNNFLKSDRELENEWRQKTCYKHKSEAKDHLKRGEIQKALKCYNEALKLVPDDKSTLVARSRCQQLLGKQGKAMKDVESALNLDPSFYEALYQKAELHFQQGDYEMALVYYDRGSKHRPDMKAFHQGLIKTQDAINRSNSARAKRLARASDLSWVNTKKTKEQKKLTSTFSKTEPRDIASPGFGLRQQNPLIKIDRGTHNSVKDKYISDATAEDNMTETRMKQILGRMYSDKKYLEQLLEQAGDLKSGSVDLHSLAENGLDFLYDRVLYWVRQGRIIPPEAPALPLPPQTDDRGNLPRISTPVSDADKCLKGKNKKSPESNKEQPQSWFRYLERKKAAEVNTRKAMQSKFLHVLEGRKLNLREQDDRNVLSPIKPQARQKAVKVQTKDYDRLNKRKPRDKDTSYTSDTDSGLNISFSTYRQPSDLHYDPSDYTSRFGIILEGRIGNKGVSKTSNNNIYKKKKTRVSREAARREQVLVHVSNEIEEIEYAYVMGHYSECMTRAEACLNTVQSFNDGISPFIMSIVARLHSYIGNAAIEMGNYALALVHHEKDLHIGEESDDDEAVSRALGNLGRIYVFKNKHQRALELFSRKVPLCKTRQETAWLYHEIGNCFLIQGQYQFAMEAALKSLRAAEEALEWSYQLQSLVLLGVAEVKLKKYSNAVSTFERARDQACLQGDTKAEDAIIEALNDVNARITEELKAFRGMETNRSEKGRSKSRSEFVDKMPYKPRSRAEWSDFSSIFIPEDDGDVSLTETGYDTDLHLDLHHLHSDMDTSLYGSQPYLQSERLLSSRFPAEVRRSVINVHSTARQPPIANSVTNMRDNTAMG